MAARPVGILALQGDFPSHRAVLERHGLAVREVRAAADLDDLAALVLPGGESTTMLRLLEAEGLAEPLRRAVADAQADGRPVLATCAGTILLAARVFHPEQPSLGLLDVDVERNSYGPQIASGVFPMRGERGFPDARGTFIRAPRIVRVGDGVEVLARRGSDPVLVRSGSILAATFHPELEPAHPATELFRRAIRRGRSRASREGLFAG